MELLTRSGLKVAYEAAGVGRPVVLLHAFPLCAEMWRPQLRGLADCCRMVAPDSRGFGGTGPFAAGDAPSVDRLADDTAELIDVLGLSEPVVLAGLSMGGYAVMAFARRYPERLAGMILADTKAEPDDDAARAGRAAMIELAAAQGARAVAEKMLPKLLAPEASRREPGVADEVLRLAGRQSSEGVQAALRALRDRPDAGPGLTEVRVPTLVIVGEHDAVTPPDAARRIVERVATARLVVVPDAGHLSNLENPGAFNAAVADFLASLAR